MWPLLAKYLTPIIKNIGLYALIGVGAFFIFGQIKSAVLTWNQMNENLGAYKLAEQVNKETIAAKDEEIRQLLIQAELQKEANERNARLIEEANQKADNLQERLARHDIDKIIERKGAEVVERAYTRGSNERFRVLESNSRSLADYGNNGGTTVSTTTENNTATGTEPPEL